MPAADDAAQESRGESLLRVDAYRVSLVSPNTWRRQSIEA